MRRAERLVELKDYRKYPQLEKYIKVVPAGAYLFRQGQLGKSMFILLEGDVELIAEHDGGEHIEALLEAGQFLGEKAMIKDSPYQRLFSARARTPTTVMELGLHDVELIQETLPLVMTDILKRAFQLAAERLAKANYMIRVLRSSDNLQRLVHCISYYCRSSGKRGAHGIEVEFAVDAIHYYIDMSRPEIEACLKEMIGEQLLIVVGENRYQVPDLNALMAWATRNKEAA